MTQIKWGMIGCGDVAEVKSGPAFSLVPNSRLSAVASRRPETAHAYAKRHNIEYVYDTSEALINSKHVDAVYIATPPSSHLDLALLVAKAGKPCCIEKPISPTLTDAQTLVEAFKTADQPLFVAYYRRSLPRFLQIKTWLEENQIGDIRHIHWSYTRPPSEADLAGHQGWRTHPKDAPGGYFEDIACHGLDVFDFLLGPITIASGFSAMQHTAFVVPDAVTANWLHGANITGSGHWSFSCQGDTDMVTISGSKGHINFSILGSEPVKLATSSQTIEKDIPQPKHIQYPHVENMVKHLTNGPDHPSLGASALRTAWVVDQILN